MRRKEDGAVLKRARKAAGLTQLELALLVDRTSTTIYLLEKPGPKGMANCSEDLALRLAKRLHRPVEDLFEEKASPSAQQMTTGSAVGTRRVGAA